MVVCLFKSRITRVLLSIYARRVLSPDRRDVADNVSGKSSFKSTLSFDDGEKEIIDCLFSAEDGRWVKYKR